MDRRALLALPNDTDTYAKVGAWCATDPTWIFEFAAAIANEGGTWPSDAATGAAQQEVAKLAALPGEVVRNQLEQTLMGRDVDNALEWLKEIGAIALLFPELQATVDLVQESDRQHKDVWAHTKQVVKQSVRRPLVRWAALLHDIGKVPTRTFTEHGVHFHGHAEVGARMFDKISRRITWDRDQRHTVRFLIKHHLRTQSYSHDGWTDSAVRRFTREMGPYVADLLDLSRADITSKRPGQRQRILAGISGLSDRAEALARQDAILPPLPTGVGNAIMAAFQLAPSRLVGELKKHLEGQVAAGNLQERREDEYYVAYLARAAMVPGISPERNAELAAAGGLIDQDDADAKAREAAGDFEGKHRCPMHGQVEGDGDPEAPTPGVLACTC